MSRTADHVDPRVVRTRKLLREALIELIPERGYDAISIKDITERATLNRATFYLHYRDKEDLLERGFGEIWNELTRENPFPQAPQGQLSLDATRAAVLRDFEHLARYAPFYRVMVGGNGVGSFARRMQDYVYRSTEERLRPFAARRLQSDVPLDIVLRFIASAYVGLMQWWLEHDMQLAPEEMADTVVRLYATSPFRAMGLQASAASL